MMTGRYDELMQPNEDNEAGLKVKCCFFCGKAWLLRSSALASVRLGLPRPHHYMRHLPHEHAHFLSSTGLVQSSGSLRPWPAHIST